MPVPRRRPSGQTVEVHQGPLAERKISGAAEDGIYDAKTYELDNEELESYVQEFTTPSGDEMVAFGSYGYSG